MGQDLGNSDMSSLRGAAAVTRGRSLVAGVAASAPEGTALFATAAPPLRAKRRSREPGRSDEAIQPRRPEQMRRYLDEITTDARASS